MTDRVRLTYQGDEPVTLTGYGSPSPSDLRPGDVVELDADAAEAYRKDKRFTAADAEGADAVPYLTDAAGRRVDAEGRDLSEPIPRGIAAEVIEQARDDAGELKGEALDEALRALDLSTSGTAAAKRERLQAAAGSTPTTDGDPS